MSTQPITYSASPSPSPIIIKATSVSENWSNHKFTLIGAGTVALFAATVSLESGLFIEPTGWAVVAALVAFTAITYFIFLLFGSPADSVSLQPVALRAVRTLESGPAAPIATSPASVHQQFPGTPPSWSRPMHSNNEVDLKDLPRKRTRSLVSNNEPKHSATPNGLSSEGKRNASRIAEGKEQLKTAAAAAAKGKNENGDAKESETLPPEATSTDSPQKLSSKDIAYRICSDLITLGKNGKNALHENVSSIFQNNVSGFFQNALRPIGIHVYESGVSALKSVGQNPMPLLRSIAYTVPVIATSLIFLDRQAGKM